MSEAATQIDFAAQRDALDLAERRHKAARQQAVAAAAQAEAEAFQAEVDGLMGSQEPIAAALAAVADAKRRHLEAEAAIEEAEAEIAASRALLPALVDAAVAGKAVSAEDVAAAHSAVSRAEHHVAFLTVVASRLAPLVVEAEAAVRVAIGEAHRPVAERGIDLRIQAAMAADELLAGALSQQQIESNRPALAAAQKIFAHGNRLLQVASDRGFPILDLSPYGITDNWPVTERRERKKWKCPAPGDEGDIA